MRTGGSENRRRHSGNFAAGGKPFLFSLTEACTCSRLGRSPRIWLPDVKWFDAYELSSFASPQKHRQGLFFLNNGKKIYGRKKQKREAKDR